jgi:hypothetical protein
VRHVSKQPEAARREALRNSGEKFRGFVYHRISTKDTETTTIPLAIIPHQKTGQNRSIIGRQRRVRGAVSRLRYEPRSRASAIRRSLAVTTTAGFAAVAGFFGLLRFGLGGEAWTVLRIRSMGKLPVHIRPLISLASPARFELTTPGLGILCSIRLSYGDARRYPYSSPGAGCQ